MWDSGAAKIPNRKSYIVMPKQNRVTPFGDIIATPARGTLTGNRGILHNEQQEIVVPYRSKAWIICALTFKGWHREIMQPGHWTELFFLDEATALAAGHRPCSMCQRERAEEFRTAWQWAHGAPAGPTRLKLNTIDAVLHEQRLTDEFRLWDKRKRTFEAVLGDLPDGVMVSLGDNAMLWWAGVLREWAPDGYSPPRRAEPQATVAVLTPPGTVAAIAAGFRPRVHESAEL